ncbi:MAG TPA: SelB C-terminal domain-containing protein, partial [Terriglobales bacterium]
GVDKQELERGMTLASNGTLHTSSRLDVKLSLLPSAKPLKNQSRVHFHSFTSEAVATVALYGIKQIEPGADAFARLRLDTPVLILPGDRFVIRQFSPVLTIGGGQVLDAAPLPKMALAERLEFLRTQAAGDDFDSKLLSRIRRRRDQGTSLAQLIAETGRTADRIDTPLSYLLQQGLIVRHGDLLIDRAVLDHVRGRLQSIVSEFHRQNPLVAGIPKESLRGQAKLLTPIFEAALAAQETGRGTASSRADMGATGLKGTTVSRALPNSPGKRNANFNHETRLDITGDLVHLPGRGVVMKDEELESRNLIEQAFASAGLKVPALKDVLAGLKIDKARAQKIMTLLLREKVLIKISDDLVFHSDTLSTLRQNLAARKLRSPRIDVAGFKDMTGVSRKYAIPLLEYLDRERVTKRVGDERVIL